MNKSHFPHPIIHNPKPKLLLIVFIFLLSILSIQTLAQERSGHMTLLAVEKIDENTTFGETANLYLEIQPGKGRVFLQTYPLSKIDTQISTRFAKEIACNYFELNCDQYDFFYTIKSTSSIIGGPSAGAALSALTTLVVLDIPYDEKVAVTGTINSGGLLGPVGGLEEKLDAAKKAKIKTVIVPKTESANLTIKALNLNITLQEAHDLNQLIYHFSGKKLKTETVNITEDKSYSEIMLHVVELLCNRTTNLFNQSKELNINLSEFPTNKSKMAKEALLNNNYYSAASYCFSANVNLRREIFKSQNISNQTIKKHIESLNQTLTTYLNRTINVDPKSVYELQTKLIVQERLYEARDILDHINESENQVSSIALVKERLYSAYAWMYFFQMKGKSYNLTQETLLYSCLNKIEEAQERYQYIKLIIPIPKENGVTRAIKEARDSYKEKDYAYCFLKASLAKAKSNTILTTIGIEEKDMPWLVEYKIKSAESIISKGIAKESFPILGYSYYKYAQSLKEKDIYSALLYSEIALEVSDLSVYFPKTKTQDPKLTTQNPKSQSQNQNDLFLLGFIIGVAFSLILFIIYSFISF